MANSDVSYPTLREVFTPLVARVLFFVRTPDSGPQAYVAIRKEINTLLEEQRAQVKRYDLVQQEYDLARFAIVAWIDEIMLQSTYTANPELYQRWKRSPLQAELYNTTNAGEEFFERLEKLHPNQKEINEIYHLCLCLGFRGRYYDEEQDFQLLELRREQAQHLPVTFPDLVEIDRKKEQVTPQPYEIVPPPQKIRPRSSSPLWAGLAAAALMALIVYFLWPSSHCGNQKVDPGEQCDISAGVSQCSDGQGCRADCTCPPPLPNPAMTSLQDAVKGFECSDITIAEVRNGIVKLAGRVQSEEQRQQVYKAVRRVQYVTDVRDSLRLTPRPFCEVIALLDPIKQQAQRSGDSIDIRPQKGCDATYYLEEKLTAEVAAAKPLQYVYVDYYVADRENVAHMIPHPEQPKNLYKDVNSFTIGETQSKKQWTILEPLGTELVTVISSARPLFSSSRLVGAERADVYIEELRNALSRDTTPTDVTATYCFINTEKK